MALNLQVSDNVAFKVAFKYTAENGVDSTADFKITAKRLNTKQIEEMQSEERSFTEYYKSKFIGWQGVKCDDEELEYSPEHLDALLTNYPALSTVILRAYANACMAREKN